jgi:hypothetical protein
MIEGTEGKPPNPPSTRQKIALNLRKGAKYISDILKRFLSFAVLF